MKATLMNEPPKVSYWRRQGFSTRACDELGRLKIGSWDDLQAYMQEVLTDEEELSLAVAIIQVACRYLDMEDKAEARRRKSEDLAAIYSDQVLRTLLV
ncbi:MAG TPA: hypothetical protein VLX28_00715 [Thermoanaerobaculia bacterium]|nr:hypothetical protein [Thermoanaerobaculia bacterium]